MSVLTFAALCFASYRFTRLVTLDTILENVRDRWWRRFPPYARNVDGEKVAPHKLGELVQCPFCSGFWVSGAWVGFALWLGFIHGPTRYVLVWWWAVAGVQGLLNALDERLTT